MGCNKQYKISITQNVFLIGQWGLFDKVICMPIDKMEVTDTDTGTARTYLSTTPERQWGFRQCLPGQH